MLETASGCRSIWVKRSKTCQRMPPSFSRFSWSVNRNLSRKMSRTLPRELGDVVDQVLVELAGVLPLQRGEGEARQVVDLDVAAGGAEQDHVARRIVHPVAGRVFAAFEDGVLGLLQDAVEAAQHDERQDDLAILGLLEVAAQDFRDGPDERTEILNFRRIVRQCPLLLPRTYQPPGRPPCEGRPVGIGAFDPELCSAT